jgi:hypothetical protein
MSDIFTMLHRAGSERALCKGRVLAARIAAEWLRFVATPTFAMMALLTAFDSSQQDVLCAAMQHASPLGGMVPMYLLMAAFHLGPWLRLVSTRA